MFMGNDMQCVILAAGRGVRMGHLTDDCPKPMLLINGRPKLAYTLETLPEEITEVVLVVGYLKEQIMDFFGEEYAGRSIRYVEQKDFNGTGGAIHLVKDFVNDRFLVLMADDLYFREDLEVMINYDLSVLAIEREDADRFAVLEVDSYDNLMRIVEFPHSSSSRLVNTAAYTLTRDFFDYPLLLKVLGSSEYGLPQTLVQMNDTHTIKVIRAKKWFPIGDPESFREAQEKIIDFMRV